MAASPGFRCECDAGYEIVPSAAGGGKCVDMNECELFPTLCNRGDLSRNACLNTDGAFECEEDLPDQCTAENNFGECWNEEVGSVTVTSCVVRVSPACRTSTKHWPSASDFVGLAGAFFAAVGTGSKFSVDPY